MNTRLYIPQRRYYEWCNKCRWDQQRPIPGRPHKERLCERCQKELEEAAATDDSDLRSLVSSFEKRRRDLEDEARSLECLIAEKEQSALDSLSYLKRLKVRMRWALPPTEKDLRKALSAVYREMNTLTLGGLDRHSLPLLLGKLERRDQCREYLRQTAVARSERSRRIAERARVLVRLSFDREQFLIRKSDYKRGHLLDNYVRQDWSEYVLNAFEHKCFACGENDDLTFDHFWLPKNEGGNFVMYHLGTLSLVSNVAVLCRSCNSAKGDQNFDTFFSTSQLERTAAIQEQLTVSMMQHAPLKDIAEHWYGRKITT